MVCSFNKKALLKHNRWIWLLFAGGILLELIAIMFLAEGKLFPFVSITGLALAVVIGSFSVRAGIVCKNRGSFVVLNDTEVILNMKKDPMIRNYDLVYTVNNVDKLEVSDKAFIIGGNICVAKGDRLGNVSQLKLDRCYEHDEEIYNRLISMERK